MIDLSTLDQTADVTFDVPVAFDDQGNPTAGFKVVGKHSQRYRDIDRKHAVASIKKMSVRGNKGTDTKTDAGASEAVDSAMARETSIAIACVTEWYGFSRAGDAVALDPDVLADVFAKRPAWLAKVSAAIADDSNFTMG